MTTALNSARLKMAEQSAPTIQLTAEEAAAVLSHLREIEAAVQAVDEKLTPEYLEENGETYIRCYIMPSGVWHLLLGTVRQ